MRWLHTKNSSWSSKRLFTIIMIYLSSLNPGWTLPRIIMTSKFLAISFSVRTEERSRGEMRRDPHKSGGGIVVYIRNSFKASIIYNSPATMDANSQQLWLKVQCRKSKSFLLCAAYRPDLVSMSRFLDDFITSFMDSLLLGMEGMVTGDLNADILPSYSCPEGRALMDLCNSLNLSQPVIQPTRTTDTSVTLICGTYNKQELYYYLRSIYFGSCWLLLGGGHIESQSFKASAFFIFSPEATKTTALSYT